MTYLHVTAYSGTLHERFYNIAYLHILYLRARADCGRGGARVARGRRDAMSRTGGEGVPGRLGTE